MRQTFILLSSLLILSGCAYIMETPLQELTVETPGAQDSLCYVYVDGFKYKFRPPETMSITDTRDDLIIDCLAPGNRRKKVVVEADAAAWTAANMFHGLIPGLSWDMASGAAYKFPEKIIVDFTDMEVQPEALPAQNNPDIIQPEAYRLEEFKPGSPRMNSDSDAPPPQFKKRQRNNNSHAASETYQGGILNEGSGASYDGQLITPGQGSDTNSKSAPNPALLNPVAAPTPPAASAPVPLYAGE